MYEITLNFETTSFDEVVEIFSEEFGSVEYTDDGLIMLSPGNIEENEYFITLLNFSKHRKYFVGFCKRGKGGVYYYDHENDESKNYAIVVEG